MHRTLLPDLIAIKFKWKLCSRLTYEVEQAGGSVWFGAGPWGASKALYPGKVQIWSLLGWKLKNQSKRSLLLILLKFLPYSNFLTQYAEFWLPYTCETVDFGFLLKNLTTWTNYSQISLPDSDFCAIFKDKLWTRHSWTVAKGSHLAGKNWGRWASLSFETGVFRCTSDYSERNKIWLFWLN